ncbi:MAG: aldo/keto reductase [Actinophytocola sp.]|uniref:aldo/keto reductase n=1 Tax=Actinophytocola sp. TaxID=1872138 RepID=UPI001329A7C5|nr:aldo/keto reductase [Actinophytocola sp.]MPZ83078.1 aldo/keto reductase [Actinophytocola sp.]
MTLPTTALGSTGPRVGVQGLGCMGMSEFYGPSDPAECRRTLDRALELGVTMFDTADCYGHGHNEELLSRFVPANRDRVVIATKFGLVRKADDPHYRGIDNSRAFLRRSVEASLRRLAVDAIDVYYAHRLDPNVPVEDTVGAMAELVVEGKIRHLGLCEVTGAQLRAAYAVHPIAAVQSEWSLFTRDVEISTVPVAAELGVALVPFSPLGRGFLTGSFASADELSADDFRRYMARFTGQNARHNTALLAPMDEIAVARGVTPGQVALAWVHQRASVHGLPVVPIPGTRHRTRLVENAAATAMVLTPGEATTLAGIYEQVVGHRLAGLNFDADKASG